MQRDDHALQATLEGAGTRQKCRTRNNVPTFSLPSHKTPKIEIIPHRLLEQHFHRLDVLLFGALTSLVGDGHQDITESVKISCRTRCKTGHFRCSS